MAFHTTCFNCGSSSLKPLKGYFERHGLIKCSDCKFVLMREIPTEEDLQNHYSNYTYAGHAKLSPVTIRSYEKLLDEFEKYRETNRILDVGCGRGWFLLEAKKRGWEVYGSEFSDKAINLGKENNISMISGSLALEKFDHQKFDVITSFEVIEHINNPHEDLKIIHHILRNGGLFYCTTPNFNSLMRYYLKADYNVIEYPEHLAYFTKTTLNNALKRNNFRQIKFLSTGISITRLKASKSIGLEQKPKDVSADEQLRVNIEKKWYLGVVKTIINSILTHTNLGLTLKGYYIKD